MGWHGACNREDNPLGTREATLRRPARFRRTPLSSRDLRTTGAPAKAGAPQLVWGHDIVAGLTTYATCEGRTVRIVTGTLSQTVRLCRGSSGKSGYESVWEIRGAPRFVSTDEVELQPTIAALVEFLRNDRHAILRDFDECAELGRSEPEGMPATIPVAGVAQAFAAQIEPDIDKCIDQFLRDFLDMPYCHRVEHSIHVQLWNSLSLVNSLRNGYATLGSSGCKTQLVHKEWPETKRRPKKRNRRGNFDLAVLAPGSFETISTAEFGGGWVAPAVAVEVGLNYGRRHLENDIYKLLNSPVPLSYAIHLVRNDDHLEWAQDLFRAQERRLSTLKGRKIRLLFAQWNSDACWLKAVHDTEISRCST